MTIRDLVFSVLSAIDDYNEIKQEQSRKEAQEKLARLDAYEEAQFQVMTPRQQKRELKRRKWLANGGPPGIL